MCWLCVGYTEWYAVSPRVSRFFPNASGSVYGTGSSPRADVTFWGDDVRCCRPLATETAPEQRRRAGDMRPPSCKHRLVSPRPSPWGWNDASLRAFPRALDVPQPRIPKRRGRLVGTSAATRRASNAGILPALIVYGGKIESARPVIQPLVRP